LGETINDGKEMKMLLAEFYEIEKKTIDKHRKDVSRLFYANKGTEVYYNSGKSIKTILYQKTDFQKEEKIRKSSKSTAEWQKEYNSTASLDKRIRLYELHKSLLELACSLSEAGYEEEEILEYLLAENEKLSDKRPETEL